MPEIVIRYEWKSQTNFDRNCIVVVNMTKRKFYVFRPTTVSNEKLIDIYNNNDSLIYHVDLKDKASFLDLVKGLRKTDFVEI